jgi:hypothetical protein
MNNMHLLEQARAQGTVVDNAIDSRGTHRLGFLRRTRERPPDCSVRRVLCV